MCGIFGLIDTPWRDGAGAALDTLRTRGPDDSAVLDLGEAVLCHTRLAVIDLVSGQQPMRSADGRYAIVFNGEIYNFRELRKELAGAGHEFTTQSDTEVLLQGFAAWGERVVPRLDGMFAFAVWDAHERVLFAARDRMGIKPFFYSTVAGFSFGSTLAPFLRLDGFPRQVDYQALRDYLACQTALAPHSFLNAVRQLSPASQLVWTASDGRLEIKRYWDIPAPSDLAFNRAELVDRVDAAIGDSVRAQLVADVPLGAFLSGGIDSGLMVHYMARAGARPLRTFNLRFREAAFDETPYARAVAERFGTEHHAVDAPQIDGASFAQAIDELDQPLADPAYVMTHALSRLTRSFVTVAISGDGGDELFGGYARFREEEDRYPRRPGQDLLRELVEAGWLPGALLRRSLHGRDRVFYRRVELGPWEVSRKSLKRYLAPDAWARCMPEKTLGLWRELAASFGGRMNTESLMRADLWTYLSDNCLAKTDRASMAHGLEVRVPLLGNAVLDSVLRLSAKAHFNGEDKLLLRDLARRYLPDSVWNRPKHGFSVPLRELFNGAWRDRCEDVVHRTAEIAPFLNAPAVSTLWRAARAGHGSRRLAYTFVVLLIWLEQHRLKA
ncbi:MAG: asparagine synthase (glutamine-hydrolyzing) [Betaproteobacteria bacterium]|nr:MAG: asparagine synthase (glutamine-hydrolyzing) [Betaproteobacteria bacterium]